MLRVAVLCLFLSSIIIGSSDESCHPVQQCSIIPSLDKYSYGISTSNWGSSSNMVCPRSDSSVSFWVFEFKDPDTQQLVSGNYCSVGVALPVESVCNNNGNSLVFRNLGDTVYNKTGLYAMKFASVETDFTADIPFYFAPTGIYSTNDTVYYSLEQNRVPSWYIFHTEKTTPEIRLYFQGSLIANQSVTMDPNTYAFFPETTICLPTATGEITSVYTLQLREPINLLSAGVYTVTMIQDGITYSSDVTIVLPMSSRMELTTSIMLTSAMSAENTPSISFSPTITSSPSNESIDQIYIVVIALTLAILIIIISSGIITCLCIAYRRKWICCGDTLKTDSTIPLHDVVDGRTPHTSPDTEQRVANPAPIVVTPDTRQRVANPAPIVVTPDTQQRVANPASIVVTPDTLQRVANPAPIVVTPSSNSPPNTGHLITRTPAPTLFPPTTELPNSTPIIVRVVHHDGTPDPTPPTDDVVMSTDTAATPPTMATPTIPPSHITVGGNVTDGSSVTIINYHYYPKPSSPPVTTSDDTSDTVNDNLKELVKGQREQIEIGRERNEILTTGLIDVRESEVETPVHDTGDIIDATSSPFIGYHTDCHSASTPAPSTVGLISSDPAPHTEDDGLVERGAIAIIAEPTPPPLPRNIASDDLNGPLFDLTVEYRDFHNVGKSISAKWNTFGEMIGLSPNELHVIAQENASINDRMSPILEAWKKTHFRTTPCNWRNVILILREMGEHNVADRAIEELVKGSSAQ